MAQKLDIDCTTGQAKVVPLTSAEQAAYDAAAAGAPAIEAARQAVVANQKALNTNVANALARLRQIQGANPNTVTLPQVAQAVSDMAGYILAIARILSNQFDGTN